MSTRVKGFINIYRAGLYHTSAVAAFSAIDPVAYYIATVPVEWPELEPIKPNRPGVA